LAVTVAAVTWGAAPAAPVDEHIVASLFEEMSEPLAAVDPQNRYLLLVQERKLIALEQLAEPAVSIAGRAVNPSTHSPHAPLDYFGLTLIELATGVSTPLALPRNAVIGFPAWAPDGSRFAFTLSTRAGTELWIGEPSETRVRKLVGRLNATLDRPCTWMPDSRRVLCRRIVESRSGPLARAGVQAADEAVTVPGELTILDSRVVRGMLESRLDLVDVVSSQQHAIGAPSAFESVDPAPSSAFLLITRLVEPYPQVSGVDPLNRVVEIWDKTGRLVKRLPASVRATRWHPSRPATLIWVEQGDGGDRVMLQDPPFSTPPTEIFHTPRRFSGLDWAEESDAALVREYGAEERLIRVWYIDVQARSEPRLLRASSIDTASERLGVSVTRTNRWGKPVLAVHDGGFYARGEAAEEGRARPFLLHVDLSTGAARRIWESAKIGYEEVVALLGPGPEALLTRYESTSQPPNYFVTARDGRVARALTDNRHPAPSLHDAVRLRLTYERADGYELSSDLYLPADYEAAKPLPLVLWAYPRQAAGDDPLVAPTRERFLSYQRAFKLMFLLQGYAVMDNVAMPVLGNATDANDTFVEQIVANAEAAVSAAAGTGLIDRSRIGAAGHSYGAFMVANLLAHSRLFNAGVALSGAYNRTLTPFGFQTERRTFWEARGTYLAMSPLLYSNQIEAPLLLVHGLQDGNAGTSPLQSTQFYQAIRGTGGQAELVLLPFEGHAYRARESVLRAATAMLDWFDRYL
jgi:dipeptidyl aminopeptidase/acylaminoacyl peptidase